MASRNREPQYHATSPHTVFPTGDWRLSLLAASCTRQTPVAGKHGNSEIQTLVVLYTAYSGIQDLAYKSQERPQYATWHNYITSTSLRLRAYMVTRSTGSAALGCPGEATCRGKNRTPTAVHSTLSSPASTPGFCPVLRRTAPGVEWESSLTWLRCYEEHDPFHGREHLSCKPRSSPL